VPSAPGASGTPVDVELETLIRARYPIIYVVSWEERRVEETLREICQRRGKKMLLWTYTTGMAGNVASRDPLAALDYIMGAPDQSVFVLKDFHPFIGDVAVTRRLRDLVYALKTSYKTLVILSPILKLPPELEKEITVVDYQLPTMNDIDRLLEGIIQSVRSNPQIKTDLTPLEREQVLKAASGLTSNEAENVFARSLVEKRGFDIDVILGEKEQIIRKSGILEYYPATEAFADVGGMDLLKDWMEHRTASFTDEARRYGLPEPKGILLLGVQGCGKSLSAKAVASLWRLPLLRLDVGKIFAGIVGSSEENMRKAIATAESVAPCILWLDELEKGFSGTQSSGFSDGGTTSRVFGTFITWLQDKKAPCFVVATSNDVSQLPPELMRKGRFDEIFFVDLPAAPERREIFEIHLKKRHRDPAKFDLDRLAETAVGYSGAEIEQVVVSALFNTFNEGARELTTDDLVKAIKESIPLSVTMREGIQKLRDWADTRARPTSSAQAETTDELAATESAARFDTSPEMQRKGGSGTAQSLPPIRSPYEMEPEQGETDDFAARLQALERKTATGLDLVNSMTQNQGADMPPPMTVVEEDGTGAAAGADETAPAPQADPEGSQRSGGPATGTPAS
jgi:ATP-dependent 26S proteasome regulatory subunit